MAFGRGLMIGLAGAGQGILSASKTLKEYKLKEMDKENDRLADERAHNSRMTVMKEKHALGEGDRLLEAQSAVAKSLDALSSKKVKAQNDGIYETVDKEGNVTLTPYGQKLENQLKAQQELYGTYQTQINKRLLPTGEGIVSPTGDVVTGAAVTEAAAADVPETTGDGTTVADLDDPNTKKHFLEAVTDLPDEPAPTPTPRHSLVAEPPEEKLADKTLPVLARDATQFLFDKTVPSSALWQAGKGILGGVPDALRYVGKTPVSEIAKDVKPLYETVTGQGADPDPAGEVERLVVEGQEAATGLRPSVGDSLATPRLIPTDQYENFMYTPLEEDGITESVTEEIDLGKRYDQPKTIEDVQEIQAIINPDDIPKGKEIFGAAKQLNDTLTGLLSAEEFTSFNELSPDAQKEVRSGLADDLFKEYSDKNKRGRDTNDGNLLRQALDALSNAAVLGHSEAAELLKTISSEQEARDYMDFSNRSRPISVGD